MNEIGNGEKTTSGDTTTIELVEICKFFLKTTREGLIKKIIMGCIQKLTSNENLTYKQLKVIGDLLEQEEQKKRIKKLLNTALSNKEISAIKDLSKT